MVPAQKNQFACFSMTVNNLYVVEISTGFPIVDLAHEGLSVWGSWQSELK